jgi:hypothetical protein
MKPDGEESEAQPMDWPDSGGVAVITWQGADAQVYRQELLAKIHADDELNLVSTQVRRTGVGPDS